MWCECERASENDGRRAINWYIWCACAPISSIHCVWFYRWRDAIIYSALCTLHSILYLMPLRIYIFELVFGVVCGMCPHIFLHIYIHLAIHTYKNAIYASFSISLFSFFSSFTKLFYLILALDSESFNTCNINWNTDYQKNDRERERERDRKSHQWQYITIAFPMFSGNKNQLNYFWRECAALKRKTRK